MAKGKYADWIGDADKQLLLESWARDGLSDEQIALNIGINVRTLYVWKKKHPQINQALKKGKEVADYEVENALFKRAKGYSYQEITRELTDGTLQVTKVVKKEMAPDVGAIAFWLKNRRRDYWRDRWENEPVEQDETGVVVIPEADNSE
ncbi:MAG: helix-turn-helix domain-containing protein [Clostridiales bacterium]|nr:helix-turn-helix domain-containing protein [Clostridiales bacterium]